MADYFAPKPAAAKETVQVGRCQIITDALGLVGIINYIGATGFGRVDTDTAHITITIDEVILCGWLETL